MANERVVIKWRNTSIWGNGVGTIYRHIFMTESMRWLPVDDNEFDCAFAGTSFTKEALLNNADNRWRKIFEKIDAGLKPDWVAVDFKCSCGSWATMGMGWPHHDSTCSFKIGPPPEVKNNDGRINCYQCGGPTKQAGGGAYNICVDKECIWYDR